MDLAVLSSQISFNGSLKRSQSFYDSSIYDSGDDTSCYVSYTSESEVSDVNEGDDELSSGVGSDYMMVLAEKLLRNNKKTYYKSYDVIIEETRFAREKDEVSSVSSQHCNPCDDNQLLASEDENNNQIDENKNKTPNCNPKRSKRGLQNSSEQWEAENANETKLTKLRWFVLLVVCLSIFVRSFISVVFGQINDVFSAYYNVPPGAVDWLTNSGSLATFCVVPIVAYIGKNRVSLRGLCILMTGTSSLGTILLTSAMMSRVHGFALAIAGQAIMGANNAIAMTIPPLVAATWFAESEVSTALAASFISVGSGVAIGSFIPATLIITPNMLNEDGIGIETASLPMLEFKLVTMFSCTAGMSILTFFLTLAFIAKRPKFPPSVAQSLRKAKSPPGRQLAAKKKNKSLMKNRDFLLIALFYGVSASSAANSITLLSSMMRDTFQENDDVMDMNDVISGRILTAMFICFSVGPFLAGRILDKTKRYRETTLFGMAGLAFSTCGITISLVLRSVLGLYASHMALGLFMGVAETALFEIASEVTYPLHEINFSCVLVMSWMAFFVLYPIVGRIALNIVTGDVVNDVTRLSPSVAASCVPSAFSVACIFLAIFLLHPEYQRHKASFTYVTDDATKQQENRSLLTPSGQRNRQ